MPVRYEPKGTVAWITIDRPEALNAFDRPGLEQMLTSLRQAGANEDIRVLVITGTGRAFSVGADIKAMDRMSEAEFGEAAALYQAMALAAQNLEKPILGAINGYALGGGLEIALMCDLRIAARTAKLGLPDAELGFSPTGGLTYLLTRMVGLGRALDMALSAELLDAEAAERIGLVTRVVDDDALLATTEALAARLAAFPRTGLKNIKRSFYAAAESSFVAALALEKVYDSDCYGTEETRKRLRDFIASRARKK